MNVTALQIIESIPSRFRAEKAQQYHTVFHFDISGEETLQYTVTISNGKCELKKGLEGIADCTIKTKASVYVDLETGKANPQMALMTGKVKVSNLSAMMQFSKCFRKFSFESSAVKTSLNNRKTKTGPLSGVKIVDFTRLLPGPLATMFLAQMGADVIKIEDPDNPDYIRDFEPRIKGVSMFYLALNNSKRSFAVNYLNEEGRKIIYNLVKQADVLIEQFRPGVMKEFGLSYEQLQQINPRLIYVSITGYGQTSSKAMDAGHDLNYIALAGALGITGNENEVIIPGFQLADIAGGGYMAMNAVTTALYQREKTGKGEWVDLSMTDAALPFSVLQFAAHQATKKNMERGKFELSGALPNYNVYRCKDNKWVALGSLEPKFWNKFCNKTDHPEWSQLFLLKGDELEKIKQQVRELFLSKTQTEWIEYLNKEDICVTPVNQIADLENDIYLNTRQLFATNKHNTVGNYKTINQPLKFKQTNFDNHWSAPELGEDSALVLKEMNYSDEDIARLKSANIIK
jgi:crotonobetainyl-CoA:carnitine CoA-transferase CaiB-like acyl-CoA transferase/putative sterol carrier protein